MSDITINDLTTAKVEGTGVFDVLMKATNAHLEKEFKSGRITGTDYSTVYLGALTAAQQSALQFVLSQEKAGYEADLVKQQLANAVTENTVLVAQECKLRAEYDLIMEQKLKSVAETALLNQKKVTEAAQTVGAGVDDDSVIGKQKQLYQSQSDGFKRDAEQKAAKLLADTWNVRRTTDSGTSANTTNMLDDAAVGRAINALLTGISA